MVDPMFLSAHSIELKLDGCATLTDVSASLRAGELVGILGPNGAGKSSLIKVMAGLITPQAGRMTLGETDFKTLSVIERALLIGYLPQEREAAWPLAVRDLVALGRYAYGDGRALKGRDRNAVDNALAECGLIDFADRRIDTLSGGERARVHLARLLASETPFILADEPVNNLDPNHQLHQMTLLKKRAKNGTGVLVVLHDLNLAIRFCDRLIWLRDGEKIADAPPDETTLLNTIRRVFAIDGQLTSTDVGPQFVQADW